MTIGRIITTEKQARETTAYVERLDSILSNEQILASTVKGLPEQAIAGVRKSLGTERRELLTILSAYKEAKNSNFEPLKQRAGRDLGIQLIVTRLEQGLSQKELARKLGLREQAVQRYETDRYRSISLANLQKVATALGVAIAIDHSITSKSIWEMSFDIEPATARKVLKHAKEQGWLDESDRSDDDALGQLVKTVADHVDKHGTPSLLRTGMSVINHSEDWPLLAWKAHVTLRAEKLIAQHSITYQPLDIIWLLDLVRLSSKEDGPLLAQQLLQQHGIILIIEPQVQGMSVDGAAFLVGDVPTIGMTILRDTLDNFWFTLLHEVAHIILHYRTGLASGFFDDFNSPNIDEIEEEANVFARNMLIPEEIWRRSPARITKSTQPIEALATQLRISPAIIFGRVRMERGNYSIFSNKIGRGVVRKQFNISKTR